VLGVEGSEGVLCRRRSQTVADDGVVWSSTEAWADVHLVAFHHGRGGGQHDSGWWSNCRNAGTRLQPIERVWWTPSGRTGGRPGRCRTKISPRTWTAAAICWPRTLVLLESIDALPLCQTLPNAARRCQTLLDCQTVRLPDAARRRPRTANRTPTPAQLPDHARPVSGASSTPPPQRAPAETAGRTSTPPARPAPPVAAAAASSSRAPACPCLPLPLPPLLPLLPLLPPLPPPPLPRPLVMPARLHPPR